MDMMYMDTMRKGMFTIDERTMRYCDDTSVTHMIGLIAYIIVLA